MSISYVHHQLGRRPLRGSRGVQGTFNTVRPRAQPCPSLPRLTPRWTEGGGPPQGGAWRRPAVRMGVRRLVDGKIIDQPGGTIFRRAAVPTLQQATRQHAQPPCDRMEPCPRLRRTMAARLRGWVTQQGPARLPPVHGLGNQGESAPRRPEAAHVQAPGRLEVLDHPVIAGHGGAGRLDVGQMRCQVFTGAGRAARPAPLPRRHHTGGAEDTPPLAAVRLLPLLGLAGLGERGGRWALEHRPARLLVPTEAQASLVVKAPGVPRQGPAVSGLGLARRSRAMPPGDPARRCAVGLVEHPPEGGAAHRPGPGVGVEHRRPGLKAPARGGMGVVCRRTRRARPHSQALCGGQSAAADRSAAPPEARRARARATGCATGAP